MKTTLILATLSVLTFGLHESRCEQPNLMIILADDMGYGDIGCYGSKQIATPNIDSLAERGVRCSQGYVSMMVCAPSRAGIMTGRYQSRFGFEHNIVGAGRFYVPNEIGLPTDEVTIADRLKELGYQTACIGKWHLGGDEAHHPNSRGFDYYFGRFKGHGYFPKASDKKIYRQRAPVETIDVPYTTDWYTKEAIDFIDRVPDGKPWFLYLAHDTPHTPLQAKKEDIARFAHISQKNRRVYCAMQHCLDENVGKLLEHLEQNQPTRQYLDCFPQRQRRDNQWLNQRTLARLQGDILGRRLARTNYLLLAHTTPRGSHLRPTSDIFGSASHLRGRRWRRDTQETCAGRSQPAALPGSRRRRGAVNAPPSGSVLSHDSARRSIP